MENADNKKNASTLVIEVGGMSCAACSARVEKVVKKLAGVSSANVNLAAKRAVIIFDPRSVKISDIKAAIKKAGYEPIDIKDKKNDEAAGHETKSLLIKFIASAVFALPLLYIAMAPMVSAISLPFPAIISPMNNPLAYALVELFLVIPIVISGAKIYISGFKNLFRLSPNMFSLIAVGSSAALIYSIYNVFNIIAGNVHAVHSLYFETAGLIVTLILLGKFLESVSEKQTSQAVKKLMALAPKTCIILDEGVQKEVPIEELKCGDIVVVKPGGRIAADGVIVDGASAVNESMLTGESMPVEKKPGDKVFAATINSNGLLFFRAEKVGTDTALSQIIRLVEEAQGTKAPIAKTADNVAGYFVPIVCAIAVLAGIAWFIAGLNGLVHLPAGMSITEFSLTIFISVLVIACPCALGLATPTAIMVATGKGAQGGILIKSGQALETAHKINMIVLDKTGTITEGKPEVSDIAVSAGIDEKYFLQMAASAELASEHPLAEAIVRACKKQNLPTFEIADFSSTAGRGIRAIVDGKEVLAGNEKFMEENNISIEAFMARHDELTGFGKTAMYFAFDKKLAGIVFAADPIKNTSIKAVELLHGMGINIAMATGDNYKTAEAIARQVKIDKVLAGVMPEGKAAEIKKLQSKGYKVAMVGDGINDAPALAAADIGMAIGNGTDIAIEAADIVLMSGNLEYAATAIKLSKQTIRIIKENLFWAFGYNALGIPIAAGLLYLFGGPLLDPIFAAAAMSLSSVSVITNALRLKRFKA